MSAKDWYARKFNAEPQQPQGRPANMPERPGPFNRPEPQQTQRSEGEQALARGDYVAAAYAWEGGEGTKTETGKCPNCGSNNYFSRQNRPAPGSNVGGGASGTLVTQNGRFEVAARCFDCNFNGMYDLQG